MHFQSHETLLQASTVSPLVTIVIPYPGSYSGPWLNSEHLAAALAAAVFYLAFSSRCNITWYWHLCFGMIEFGAFVKRRLHIAIGLVWKDCTMWLDPTSALPRNRNLLYSWLARWLNHLLAFLNFPSLPGPVFWPKLRPWREGDGRKKQFQTNPPCCGHNLPNILHLSPIKIFLFMDPPNFHSVKSQQNPCHRLLASAADQDEAEGDYDGICVQAEPCLYLLSSLDSKIH